jgi:alcohol dehydrogenase class IV
MKDKMMLIMKNIKLEISLTSLGIAGKDLDVIIENGFNTQRVKNNPRKIT